MGVQRNEAYAARTSRNPEHGALIATGPILAVRGGMHFPIRRILTPTDFSDHSERATVYAAALARELKADLVFLHVVETPTYGVPFAAPPPSSVGIEFHRIARDTLETAAKLLRENGMKVDVVVAEGTPHSAIVDIARKEQANLIVMATHGRTGLARALIGSVAEKVVRTSPIPVLTVSLTE